jgi:hypothetical protein
MITLTGRDILAKYLIGQIDSYASHIAIGCGSLPTTNLSDYSSKTELDFEMARYPIISRSISTESITLNFTQVQALADQFIFTIATGVYNSFKIGNTIKVSGQSTQFNNSGDPATNSNGTYIIIDSSPTKITVNSNYPSGSTVDQTVTGQTISITGYIPQIVFVAELPSTERYEITEFGIYPSGSNQYSNGSDSRIVANFTQAENWQYFSNSASTLTDILYYSTITNSTNNIIISDKAFQTNSNNSFFIIDRVQRQERPRFLKDAMIISGDMSDFSGVATATGDYIQLSNFSLDLSKNSSIDRIKIAYSLINKLSTPSTIPKSLNIMLQFVTTDGNSAKYHYRVTNNSTIVSSTNRYNVLSLPIGQTNIVSSVGTIGTVTGTPIGSPTTWTATISNMKSTSNLSVGDTIAATTGTGSLGSGTVTVKSIIDSTSITVSSNAVFTAGTITDIKNNNILLYVSQTAGFDWKNVKSLKIYAGIENAPTYAGTAITDYSIALDSIRFENKSNTNPLYGLVGYTVVKTDGVPLLQDSGTNNMVEFKFVVGVSSNV